MNAKPLLIETIRIQNGRVRHINYHNQRCNASRKSLFGSNLDLDLRKYIDTTKATSNEVKCRVTYDTDVIKVEYEPYTYRPIRTLEYVEVGDFEYAFKYANRDGLKEIFAKRREKDDVLMIKNGFITDTFYANVALEKDGLWYTPKNPLLKGCCRERLLDLGKITEKEIHIDDINEYRAISLFNAMIPFKRILIAL